MRRRITSFFIAFIGLSLSLFAQDSASYQKAFKKVPNGLGIAYHLNDKGKRSNFQQALGRADHYFPYLDSMLKAHKLPTDLKFMAVALSQLKFDHFDTLDGARGLWHFNYRNAKLNGLNISSYIDERRDILKSTKAFCQSIATYHALYKNWELAIAAYVSSAPDVNTAIRYAGDQLDYRKIKKDLPIRAQFVIDRWIAAYYLYHNKAKHKLTPSPFRVPQKTTSFYASDWLSFSQVAKAMKVEESVLQQLNPIFKRGIVPNQKDSFLIRIPLSLKDSISAIKAMKYEPYAAAYFEADEKNTQKKVVKVEHTVTPGETLNSIAAKYKCEVDEIKEWNSLEDDDIKVGQVLKIEKEVVAPKPPARKFIYHKVRSGETLSHIAARYRCRVSDIQRWNGLRSSRIYAGQRLRIYR